MKKKLMSEEEVKKALDITDFRSLSKEKVMQFVSLIPKVDKELAMCIINQIPNYLEMAKEMVNGMIHLCDEALHDAKIGRKDVIESYRVVLETLKERLKDESLTVEDKNKITDDMIAVAEKIDAVNDKHNAHIKDILIGTGKAILGVAVICVAIFGAIDNNKDNK